MKPDVAEFLHVLTEDTGCAWNEARGLAGPILRGSSLLARIYERQTNGHQRPDGTWWEEAAARDERREAAAEERVRKAVLELNRAARRHGLPDGFAVVFGGDPRGPALILVLPSGRTNDCGRRGWCVP